MSGPGRHAILKGGAIMTLNIRKLLVSITFVTALILTLIIPQKTFAATEEETTGSDTATTGVGFYISAQIPENQINSSLTYFDLLMAPDTQQTLAVEIVNEGTEDIVVDVSVISASTNSNGLIDYRTPDIRDETLLYPFSDIAEVQNPEITIEANSSAIAYVDIEMPISEYDGTILGGIVVSRQEDTDSLTNYETEQSGSTILNHYSYVVGVKLTETDAVIQPNFTLVNVEPQTVDYKAAIVHYLRNTEALIVKDLSVSLTISEYDSAETVLETDWTIDMAPNSIIELPALPENGQLEAGKYLSHMELVLDGEVLELEYVFTIDGSQIREISGSVITEQTGIPLWAWVIIVLLIVLIVTVTILFIILYKRRRKDDETNPGNHNS